MGLIIWANRFLSPHLLEIRGVKMAISQLVRDLGVTQVRRTKDPEEAHTRGILVLTALLWVLFRSIPR